MRNPTILCVFSAVLAAQTQQQVVPAAYQSMDAVSYVWLPGASADVRQQTLVGSSHLQSMLNRDLTAIEFRRTAANEVYQGGSANLTVTLSTSPNQPLTVSNHFAANPGPDAVQVFAGPVTLPTSPATTGPTVDWTTANTVRIPFQQPFRYSGGTLCIDILGVRIAGQTADWWMADAEFEDITGSAVHVGNGCGQYGGAQGIWSFVEERSLLPGAYARFSAYGTANGLGVAAFGVASPIAIPLSLFSIPTPGCDCHLIPSNVLGSVVGVFQPMPPPIPTSVGGHSSVLLRIPAATWVFGMQLTTQWLDLTQLASSNAITWTVASAMPTLDMALVDGHPLEATGNVSVHLAHVIRFEHQAP